MILLISGIACYRFDSSSGTDREKIATMIKEPSAVDALKAHFLPRISFGTAGLRAAMAPGYTRLNFVPIAL